MEKHRNNLHRTELCKTKLFVEKNKCKRSILSKKEKTKSISDICEVLIL